MRPPRGLLLALTIAAGCQRPAPEPAARLPAVATSSAALAGWPARLDALTGHALDAEHRETATGVPLARLRAADRPTLYAFWASYCPPCLAEMPALQALHAAGEAVVGVGMDGDAVEASARILAERGARYPNLILDAASMKAAGKALEAGLPFTLVVDAAGAPRVALLGESAPPTLAAALARARAP